ncbi:MAG: UDP-N-acetylglucosamine 2-epimerase (non-hydrolyzing) [Elusimicrobia bacterium]|jgi:UDP-N-acetylglucosamine 2-epimerase (non-hydrolysing)|nr:UDP-N-acetylglucosamine 2-epimerase (non-hydrolyzing) [Elusimicrobiota bacterium]
MAPLILALQSLPREFNPRIIVTAQHRDMLDQVLRLFDIRPHHDLGLMRSGQSLTDISVRALSGLEPVFQRERPDLVLVHGDTSTALMATLAAFYQKVPVGHVEAGLRSHEDTNPFPEEMNRKLTDSVALLHFAPTALSKKNLLREGVRRDRICITGNTGIDALHQGLARLKDRPALLPNAVERAAQNPFVLVTAHRRENFGRPLENAFRALRHIARARPSLHWIYPVHPNPNVQGPARRILGGLPNFCLTEPLDYGPLISLMKRCLFTVTDSGGIQEEAPSLGKPVLVLRDVTERPEAVRAGTVRLMGTQRDRVTREIENVLNSPAAHKRMARAINPYGDGRAASRIVAALRHWANPRTQRPKDFIPK